MSAMVSFLLGAFIGGCLGAVVMIILALAASGHIDAMDDLEYDHALELTQEEIEGKQDELP